MWTIILVQKTLQFPTSQRKEERNPSKSNQQTHTHQWGKEEAPAEFTVCSSKEMLFYSHNKSSVVEQNKCKHSSL